MPVPRARNAVPGSRLRSPTAVRPAFGPRRRWPAGRKSVRAGGLVDRDIIPVGKVLPQSRNNRQGPSSIKKIVEPAADGCRQTAAKAAGTGRIPSQREATHRLAMPRLRRFLAVNERTDRQTTFDSKVCPTSDSCLPFSPFQQLIVFYPLPLEFAFFPATLHDSLPLKDRNYRFRLNHPVFPC
jgi:hypothetical protein